MNQQKISHLPFFQEPHWSRIRNNCALFNNNASKCTAKLPNFFTNLSFQFKTFNTLNEHKSLIATFFCIQKCTTCTRQVQTYTFCFSPEEIRQKRIVKQFNVLCDRYSFEFRNQGARGIHTPLLLLRARIRHNYTRQLHKAF